MTPRPRPMPPRPRRSATAVETCLRPFSLVDHAPAKVNLTLRVLGAPRDGYHELESLVVFADFGDRLSFVPWRRALVLTVHGPSAGGGRRRRRQSGAQGRARARRAACRPRAGRFRPRQKAAGRGRPRRRLGRCGGGAAPSGRGERHRARRCGSLSPRRAPPAPTCRSASIRARASCAASANVLSAPLALPPLPAVLVNPGVALPTKAVFAGWKASPAAATALDEAALAKLTSARELVGFWPNRPTIWSRLPSRCSRRSPMCWPLCANVLAARWRACPARARPASDCSARPMRRRRRKRLSP